MSLYPFPLQNKENFNPIYYIAYTISKLTNLPIDFRYINKIKDTKELKSIVDLEERREMLRNIFNVDLRYRGKKILLLDDLYRSGATLNEITNTLYRLGKVNNVYVFTLTKTRVAK